MRRLCIFLAIGILFISFVPAHAQITKNILGNWKSIGAEDLHNGSFATRVFEIHKTKWSVTFTMYGDKDMKYPLFAYYAEGPYSIGDTSQKVKGAYNATFKFTKKTLTLLTSDEKIIKQLGFSDCGLKKGVSKDISQQGCSFLPSVAAYGQEFDVVKVDSNNLYFGARPADGNMGTEDKRPIALNYPLAKFGKKK